MENYYKILISKPFFFFLLQQEFTFKSFRTVRENAAQILATQDLSKHKEVILVLLSALKDENRWVRYFSIEALGRQDSSSFPNIIDGLLDAFQEPDVDIGIQRKVVEVLGYQDLQDHKLALETLIKAMDSKDK